MSVFFLLPTAAFASVQISEIAWMGFQTSTANEWIELHNTGSDEVALSGWKIVSVPAKLSIALKGTIAPDAYYLIERTDDDSVSGIPADLIGSFSLLNDGMTLDLVDAGGVVQDEVIGGSGWKNIGGDAKTFDTPQRTPSGWVTAVPTPRAPKTATERSGSNTQTQSDESTPAIDTTATNTPSTVEDIAIVSQSSQGGGSSGSASTEKKTVTRDGYRIVVHASARIYKDIPTTLHAVVTGLHDEPLPNANVTWNFGDGTTATGTEVVHSYRFAGTYSVIVNAQYAGITATTHTRAVVVTQDVHITTALPGMDGYVSVVSPVDIDLSGWSLRDGNLLFTFPPQTQLFGKVPATFPNAVTGMYVQQTLALFRPDGRLMSAVEKDDEASLTSESYSGETLALARSATQPPVLTKVATTTATSLGAWQMANVSNGFHVPTWGYWVIAAFFVAAAGTIVVLSSAFDPKLDADSEAAKYTYIELDSNLEDIT
jgi:PKD repeat protein